MPMPSIIVDGLTRQYRVMRVDHEFAQVTYTRKIDHVTKTIVFDSFVIPVADVDHLERWIDRVPETEIIPEKESKQS